MKNNIMILDCTLRDGGYVNGWEFGKDNIKNIVNGLSSACIDIIEIGFLTEMEHSEGQSLFSNKKEIEFLNSGKRISKFAGMIAIGEKELDPSTLEDAKETGVDIVRITFHNEEEELKKAFSFATELKRKGYEVCMQPIGTTVYTDDELVELIHKINTLKPYAFYLVDTLGIMHDDELMHLMKIADENLSAGIKLGFHSHNNLQMSYSNAQLMVGYETSRDLIIDSSLYGMGRGAGNLCTELIANFCNERANGYYNMIPILEIIDSCILPLSLKYKWGYDMHYNLAARHRCHPNYATYLMNKQTLKMNQVNLLLQNLPKATRHVFNKSLIEELYHNFQNKNINDDDVMAKLKNELGSKKVLVLAPGHSIVEHLEEINNFINTERPIVFSVNFSPEMLKADIVFMSNWKRFYDVQFEQIESKIIVTSNLPALSNKFMSVNYEDLCDYTFEEPDNAGIMVIRLLKELGVTEVFLAGFDGFSGKGEEDFYNEDITKSQTESAAAKKNESISKQILLLEKNIKITFLTPSLYKGMLHEEI